MASQEEDDDQDYRLVLLTLEEAKLMNLKSIFKENCLEDETLFLMTSEKELREYLTKEITPPLPAGQGFKFSRHWFKARNKDDASTSSKQVSSRMAVVPDRVTYKREDVLKLENCKNPQDFPEAGEDHPEISKPDVFQSNTGKYDVLITSSKSNSKLDETETLCIKERCTPQVQEEIESFQPILRLPGNESVLGSEPNHSTAPEKGNSSGFGGSAQRIPPFAPDTSRNSADEPHDLSAGKLNRDTTPESNNRKAKKVEKCTSEVKTNGNLDTPTGSVVTNPPPQSADSDQRPGTLSTTADEPGYSTSSSIASSIRGVQHKIEQANIQLEFNKELSSAATSSGLPRINVNAQNDNPNPPVQQKTTDIQRTPFSAQGDAGKKLSQASQSPNGLPGVAQTPGGEYSEGVTNEKDPSVKKSETENQGGDCNESITGRSMPKKEAEEQFMDLKGTHSSTITSQKQSPDDSPDENGHGRDCRLMEENKIESRTSEDPKTLAPSTKKQPKQNVTSDSEIGKENVKTASKESPSTIKGSEVKKSLSREELRATQLKDEQGVTSRCEPYPFGSILRTDESQVVEFKSFANEIKSRLPWKIMEKAKRFICGCLNSAECKQGIIYFGIGEGQGSTYKRGEVHGLDVELLIDKIKEAFQVLLEEHLWQDDGPIQKAEEEQCISLEFVPVDGPQTNYVVKIEVSRDWIFCKDNIYCCKRWTGKSIPKSEQENSTKAALGDFYKVATNKFEYVVHSDGGFQIIKQPDSQKKLKELLTSKYKEWKSKQKSENDSSGANSSQPMSRKEEHSGEEDSPLVSKTNTQVGTAKGPLENTNQRALDENANKSEDDRSENCGLIGSTDKLSRPKYLSGDDPNSCTTNERLNNSTEPVESLQVADANRTGKPDGNKNKVSRCKPRPFYSKGRDTQYAFGSTLDAEENREVEFKSFAGEHKGRIPWKIMEKAKKFICGCLNSSKQGIIYFGIEDDREIRGLDVESSIDDISKAFQAMLDDHLWSDDGQMQKGGDQQCVRLEFVPVTSADNDDQSSQYVVEIGVSRDWNLCADKIYYSKQWKEKRSAKCEQEDGIKMSLSDCYKVDKDEFDDAVIRTNAASRSIKKLEVQKQVKQPLVSKYKDWKRQNKSGLLDVPVAPHLDDADTQRISSMVRERLYNLNFKEYDYILITNKLAPELRGTPHLSFLQNIPWAAVFDIFDPSTKADGLHYVCNESTDAPRATNKTLDDFKHDFALSTRETTWVSCKEPMDEDDWIERYKDCLYRAISAYKSQSLPGHLICVFLALSETSIKEMSEIMECCVNILGESAPRCISILSESTTVADSLIKASKKPLKHKFRTCTISGLPWSLLEENVRDMIGPNKFEDRKAKTGLPYCTGKFKEVLNKKIYSWNDLEVYSPNPKLSSFMGDIEKARDNFYKGGQIGQMNLFHNHDIRRTMEKEVCKRIDDALKNARQHSTDVEIIKVPYEAGSGATTLCRRILWEKRTDYRCAVVKALTPSTGHQIDEFQKIVYDEKTMPFALPVIVLVDNFPEVELAKLRESLRTRLTKCVILSTFPISKYNKDMKFDITRMQRLDQDERDRVKDILMTITKDEGKRKDAEVVLEREMRFIWFGLELFGADYIDIEGRLRNHIDGILAQNFLERSRTIYETILNFCCLLHHYNDSRTIFPHPILIDCLYDEADHKDEVYQTLDKIHDSFGGLLLQDYCDTHGYYGWRPAHSLVSEVVKSRMNLEETSKLLLEKIIDGHSYTKKYLAQEVVKMFLQRKKIFKPILVQELQADDGFDSDFDFDGLGFPVTRTKYSPLIMSIMIGDDGIKAASRLFIRLCEKVTEVEDKAYSWQQLARFIGYEFGIADIDEQNKAVFVRMHTAMQGLLEMDGKLSMPRTAIEAAHRAIDVAIEYQQSYSHHYVTKGHLHLLELRGRLNDQTRCINSTFLMESIQICKQAFDAYDKGEKSAGNKPRYYPVIGKIDVMISILRIVKRLSCFMRDSCFSRYLNNEEIPEEVNDLLSQTDNKYIQNVRVQVPDLLNQIFGDVKLRRMTTWDKREIQALDDTCVRIYKLRRKFYEVTGLGRTSFCSDVRVDQTSSNSHSSVIYQEQTVENILFQKEESSYSNWNNLSPKDISAMYKLLKDLCRNGQGSHNAMLICCKACLRLDERPSVAELKSIVTKWVQQYPKSAWAHLFNYMLHFPIPNGSLAMGALFAVKSCKECASLVSERTGKDSRKKSRAEYFLGKGKGLNALVCATDMPWRKIEQPKTEFWRSQEIFNKLERVCGQKDVNCKGVLVYQGIRVTFDDSRYPKQSRDDLWFFLGFTVAGPYAFDPLDKDDYDLTKKHISGIQPRQLGEDTLQFAGFGRGKRRVQYDDKSHKPGEHVSRHASQYEPRSFSHAHCPIGKVSVSTTTCVGHEQSLDKSLSYDTLSEIGKETSAALSPGMHTTSKPDSYAYAAKSGKTRPQRAKSSASLPTVTQTSAWKTVQGKQGENEKTFKPWYVDKIRRLHHGAFVLGVKKSEECPRHTTRSGPSNAEACPFAHSWKGDTLQQVCTECTKIGYHFCKEKNKHKAFIWNLGPYYDAHGTRWMKPSGN